MKAAGVAADVARAAVDEWTFKVCAFAPVAAKPLPIHPAYLAAR